MRGRSHAQVSIEYTIVVGAVLFLVVIPSAIFLSSFAKNSLYGQQTTETTQILGEALVENAKQVYYLGLYAKKKITVRMPDNLNQLYFLTLNDGSNTYNYIVARVDDGGDQAQQYYFLSDIPITTDLSRSDTTFSTYHTSIPECQAPSASCSSIAILGPVLRPGEKEFEFETVLKGGDVQVQIVPTFEP